ncbi:hypothetical protein [Flindersiella endophytica]
MRAQAHPVQDFPAETFDRIVNVNLMTGSVLVVDGGCSLYPMD